MASSRKKAERRDKWTVWSHTPGAIDELCDAIAAGAFLTEWCREMGFAYTTVAFWLGVPERAAAYARAREFRADVKAEEIERIADEPVRRVETQFGSYTDSGAVAHQKLRVDTRRWLASKMHPRRYGEKVEVEAHHTHDVIGELREFLMAGGSRLPIAPGKAPR